MWSRSTTRNTFRYGSRKCWDQIAHDLRPVYTAATEAEARARFEEFAEKWGKPYPAIIRLWQNAWSEFVPFLDYGACRRLPRPRREWRIGGGAWPRGLVEPAGSGGA
jgi:transposase-like protein